MKEINKIIKSLNEIPEPFSVDGIIKIFENNSKKIIKNFAIYFYKENGETILWNISNNKFDLKNGFKFQLIARNYNFGFIIVESEIQKEYLYILINHLSLILYSEKLSFLANRDRLTGIYNRGYVFRYLLNKEKSKEIYSIVIIDLDKFKHYNDSYGHNVGDYILKTAVKVIKESLKKISYKSIFARYGGEEFIIVFDINNKKELFNSMEFIRNKINETDFSTEEYSLKATASFGGAIKEENISLDDFIDNADKSLYKAKQTGRNKSVI
ncbi:GGDEF domain-containing protein [Brachyspira sp.]|uniref:GGDEF domain-containing protein n=1 Tax=Brachyspira sp. TaxID=1977261 RepID=UPI003D7E7D78